MFSITYDELKPITAAQELRVRQVYANVATELAVTA
jgi:hypothetical protein